jgi:hypothetical protein
MLAPGYYQDDSGQLTSGVVFRSPRSHFQLDTIHGLKDSFMGTCKTFVDIPYDIFISIVQPYLSMKDIVHCSGVSKQLYEYFNYNDIWKDYFIQERIIRFYKEYSETLIHLNVQRNEAELWSSREVYSAKCPMVIINESSIPFDIFWVDNGLKLKRMSKELTQGDKYICKRTFPNHKWICIPTQKWYQTNPVSNVGFSFIIDIFNLETYNDKLCYIKTIHEPKQMNPIKKIHKKYKSYKHQFMKLVIDPKSLLEEKRINETYIYEESYQLEKLMSSVKYHENKLKEYKNRVGFIDVTLKAIH